MLPIRQALAPTPPNGGNCGNVPTAVGISLIGSALHRVNATARQRSQICEASPRSRRRSAILRFRSLNGHLSAPGSFPRLLRPLLTSARVSPNGSPQVRARCSIALPPHLPPGAHQTPSVCCATSARPVGLLCGSCPSAHDFDSLRSPSGLPCGSLSPLRYDSPSLPSPGWLPFPGWPQMVVSSFS